jgi:predicted RNA polymerase sigma factor
VGAFAVVVAAAAAVVAVAAVVVAIVGFEAKGVFEEEIANVVAARAKKGRLDCLRRSAAVSEEEKGGKREGEDEEEEEEEEEKGRNEGVALVFVAVSLEAGAES